MAAWTSGHSVGLGIEKSNLKSSLSHKASLLFAPGPATLSNPGFPHSTVVAVRKQSYVCPPELPQEGGQDTNVYSVIAVIFLQVPSLFKIKKI